MTEIVNIEEKEVVDKTVSFLIAGEPVVIPTDTIYGVAASIASEKGIQKIFTTKSRPYHKPIMVYIDNFDQLNEITQDIPDDIIQGLKEVWPGAMGGIFNKTDKIPSWVTANKRTVLVRIPRSEFCRKLVKKVGPIAVTSANKSSMPHENDLQGVIKQLDGKVPFAVDGGVNPEMLSSTIMTFTGAKPALLREGAMKNEYLQQVFKDIELKPAPPTTTIHSPLSDVDPDVYDIIEREKQRQWNTLELTASANYTSYAILEATGSVLTNKVIEGYVGNRYFSGCEHVDELERLTIERAKKLFNAEYVNVQSYSCTQANQAIFLGVLNPSDRILSMGLDQGGHLSHGASSTMTGKHYDCHHYKVEPHDNYCLDYDKILSAAKSVKPQLIIAGGSAYPRIIDWSKFREIADEVGALLLADMSHNSGQVATGLYPSPIDIADFVTTSTQKTTRGPRSGLILLGKHSAHKYAKKIDRAVFPGMQGAVHPHAIAAKAVMLKEASSPEFAEYQAMVVNNAKSLAHELMKRGFELLTGGTDTHLMLLDLRHQEITGREAEQRLEDVGILANRNMLPDDKRPHSECSGIRIGTPTITTRGFKSKEMGIIAEIISELLNNTLSSERIKTVKKDVGRLCETHSFGA